MPSDVLHHPAPAKIEKLTVKQTEYSHVCYHNVAHSLLGPAGFTGSIGATGFIGDTGPTGVSRQPNMLPHPATMHL